MLIFAGYRGESPKKSAKYPKFSPKSVGTMWTALFSMFVHLYWNMLEKYIHKNWTYLNILEIWFCHVLEYEKYTGKHTGIYWNFKKKFAGHPEVVPCIVKVPIHNPGYCHH